MDQKQLGTRIAERRRALGMTQKQLADRLHITDRAVSRWERGVGSPDLSLIAPLCDALSMTADELLRGIAPVKSSVRPSEERPHVISFPKMMLTRVMPVIWPILAIAVLCIPSAPTWLVMTAVIAYTPLMLLHWLLCMHLFYRCPRCGHILWHMQEWAFWRRLFDFRDNCIACGLPIFVDTTPAERFREWTKNDRSL